MMRMACVMCQIVPIKADLYFLFIPQWGRRNVIQWLKKKVKRIKGRVRETEKWYQAAAFPQKMFSWNHLPQLKLKGRKSFQTFTHRFHTSSLRAWNRILIKNCKKNTKYRSINYFLLFSIIYKVNIKEESPLCVDGRLLQQMKWR